MEEEDTNREIVQKDLTAAQAVQDQGQDPNLPSHLQDQVEGENTEEAPGRTKARVADLDQLLNQVDLVTRNQVEVEATLKEDQNRHQSPNQNPDPDQRISRVPKREVGAKAKKKY